MQNSFDITMQPREYCEQMKKSIRALVIEFESNINGEMNRIVQEGPIGNTKTQRDQYRNSSNEKLEYLRSVREELLPTKYRKLPNVSYSIASISSNFSAKPEPMSSYFKVFLLGIAILVGLGFTAFLILVL